MFETLLLQVCISDKTLLLVFDILLLSVRYQIKHSFSCLIYCFSVLDIRWNTPSRVWISNETLLIVFDMFLLVVWIPHKETPSRVLYITLLGVLISDATLHLLFNRSQSYELVRSEGVRRKMVSVHLHESWVLGSLWWLDQERKQHGRQFAVCMINFGQIFYILTTSAAREVK